MNTKRQPKGIPTGGEFAANSHDEAGANLAPGDDMVALVDDGYSSRTFAEVAKEEGIDISEVQEWAEAHGHEVKSEELIRVGEDAVDRDDIADILRDGNNYDVGEVLLAKYEDDTTAVVTRVNHNLLWDDQFSEEELDHYRPIVEETYHEWFNADIDVRDSWENADVEMVREVPDDQISDSTAIDAAYGSYADFTNKTDPGTFGSPYIGSELRKRIDNSRLVSERFNLTPGEVPSDLSKEKITDSEALAISQRLNEYAMAYPEHSGEPGERNRSPEQYKIEALRQFNDSGVMNVEDVESGLRYLEANRRISTLTGEMSYRKSKELQALSGAMKRWIDDRPVFEKNDEED